MPSDPPPPPEPNLPFEDPTCHCDVFAVASDCAREALRRGCTVTLLRTQPGVVVVRLHEGPSPDDPSIVLIGADVRTDGDPPSLRSFVASARKGKHA